MMKQTRWLDYGLRILAVVIALLFTMVVLLLSNANPFEAFANILMGSVGSINKFSDVLVSWVPLLLATAGVLVTFSAGLWNIGMEGQITLGAIFTTLVLRLLQDSALPPFLIILLGVIGGMIGGMLWASLVAMLRIYGGVNEIFGGLGMNFIATALTIWLIFGPWKRPGVGSMSGTEQFDEALWLPTFEGLRLSPWSLGLAIVALLVVFFLLNGTTFGLKLKAVGKNPRSAFMMGIPTTRYMMIAFLLCGLFAGLTGAMQVTAVYHRLIPSISSGYGFTGLMVGMLANYQAIASGIWALLFAILNIGSIQLPMVMKLDSTLSGVLQGALVLSVLLMEGVRQKLLRKRQGGAHG